MNNGLLISTERVVGCLATAYPAAMFRARYFDALRAYWNRPVSPDDVSLETYGYAGFDSLRVGSSGAAFRWQMGTLTIEERTFPMLQTCWSTNRERFRPLDWLRQHHPRPIVLFGDGPMFDDPDLEFAFLADLC